MRIVNFGSLNVDYVYQVDHIAVAGETISSSSLTVNSGGKGLNQSIAAARAGAKVCHAGAIGKSDESLLKHLLAENGVDTSLIDSSHSFSGSAMIQVDKNGQNCIVLYGGANQEISKEFALEALKPWGPDDVLLLQNEISNIKFIMEQAHQKKMKICFNPSPISKELFHYPLAYVDTLILNEIEGAQLSGESKAADILTSLLQKYPDMKIVLTLGSKGVIYADRNRRVESGIFEVPVVDTTAAGDTFTGFYLASVEKDGNIKNALKMASAAAAIAVSHKGAACSIPNDKEVKDFLKAQESFL